MSESLKRLLHSPQGLLGLVIIGLALLLVVFGAWIAPYDPNKISLLARYQAPSFVHWFGTDNFGRDLFSRVVIGARATILSAVGAMLISTSVGAVIGTTSAYIGGRIDEAVMRTLDAIMAIPSLLFALLIVSTLGQSASNALIAVAISGIPSMVRISRSVALSTRQLDYVSAARARGESSTYIIIQEILPNIISPIIVESTIRVAFAIMLFATLSFLGLGAQPPSPEWGLMVSSARAYVFQAPWMMYIPGLAIAAVAIGFNLLGDGLRDALNPRSRS
ncbi:MAG TPA: ABC transporter permease [Castellaniella sp.]|uniref:ABC transporter permease n=1 Tax=Castellaniella sp. TaxID=1955812 RepID=UPI002F233537